MQIRRLGVGGVAPHSALREFFCVWSEDGRKECLMTLDITLWEEGDPESYNPQPEGTFVGAEVQLGPGSLGTITDYPVPSSVVGGIRPLVAVEPDPTVNLDMLPNASAASAVSEAELVPNTAVVVLARGGIHGFIREVPGLHTYPEPGCQTRSLLLQLPTIADLSIYGAPVGLENDPTRLVGMLLTGEVDPSTGYTHAQCYPAYLI